MILKISKVHSLRGFFFSGRAGNQPNYDLVKVVVINTKTFNCLRNQLVNLRLECKYNCALIVPYLGDQCDDGDLQNNLPESTAFL